MAGADFNANEPCRNRLIQVFNTEEWTDLDFDVDKVYTGPLSLAETCKTLYNLQNTFKWK